MSAAETESPYVDKTFTIAQTAATELHCSRAYVNKLMRDGRLGFSKVGSRVIIRGRDIRKLLDDCAAVSS
jgi:excisionase family DNA binding protein